MKQALLIIDVQRALFDAEPRPFEAAEVVERINDLSARARLAGVPVVFIQHEDAGSLAPDSEGWRLQAGLSAKPADQFIRKRTADSFLGTPLGELLTARNIGRVVVAGYASEFCVDTTVRRAAALGYAVRIAADAHTTHDKPHAPAALIRAHHNATLSDISSLGPKIEALPAAQIDFSG